MPEKKLTTKILEFLREYPGASIRDISQTLGVSLGITRAIIYRLKNNGYVEKAGSGYILTSKGEWLLSKITGEATHVEPSTPRTHEAEEHGQAEAVEHPIETRTIEAPRPVIVEAKPRINLDEILGKMRELENRIKVLEEKIEEISKKINELSVASHQSEKARIEKEKVKHREKKPGLPAPIMGIKEARNLLGSQLDKLLYERKVVQIGSLIVESSFYDKFVKKFPLSVRDAEKLSPAEKRLLEEMKHEAKVILKAGKHYELIETY